MDIGWAIAVLKNGERVRRAHWAQLAGPCQEIDLPSWVHLYYEQRENHMPCLMALRSDGKASHFAMTENHLMADDWEPATFRADPQTDLRDRIAALAEDLRYVLNYRGPGHAHEKPGVWDTSGKPCEHCARLALARKHLDAATALRRLAAEAQCPTPETHNWGCGCPSDVAAAVASCPGYETKGPSPCRCPCYGCKHHCGAHDPSRLAAEAQPEPDDTDLTETDIDRLMAAGVPVQIVTAPPNTRGAEAQQPETEAPSPVHAVPLPGSNGISSCCGRPPCEFVGERVTRNPDEVTCTGRAVPQQPAAADTGEEPRP